MPSLLVSCSWFPMLLLIAVWIFYETNARRQGGAMGFGRSKAKMMNELKEKLHLMMLQELRRQKKKLRKLLNF